MINLLRNLKVALVNSLQQDWVEIRLSRVADSLLQRPDLVDKNVPCRYRKHLEFNPVTGMHEAFVPNLHGHPTLMVFAEDQDRFQPDWTAAAFLYNAYCFSSGGLNFRGERVPEFNDLPQPVKDHWLFTARMSWHFNKENK